MMRGRPALPFLLVLMCASAGWTQTSVPSRNETSYTTRKETSYTTRNATSVFPSLYPKAYNCTKRDGTSLTALMDKFMMYQSVSYYIEQVLNRLSARFPCVIRQYTSVVLDYKETNETITTDKNIFLKSITRSNWENFYDYYVAYNHMQDCNQSLLYGLKRALEISPAESIIIVYTFGSITDYNDTKLMSDVYTLLEKKKSQVHFLWDPWYCAANSSQQDIFNNLSSPSFGQVINTSYLNYFKLMKSMELLLSKPLNSSVRILDLNLNLNVTTNYTKGFNITNSLKHLLIAGVDTFTLNFTNPNGSAIVYEKIPSDSYYYRNYVSYYLVKSPAMGVWTLNAKGNGSLNVRILGFTGLQISGNCSDSACHPNATCGEFGGEQQCTCKEGFTGDGYSCEDIDECMDYYSNNCNYYASGYCVNTIGSYTCNCYGGGVYKKELGCVNIDRCADSSLNDCHPLAVCTNYNYGYYTCTCPYGYYGDGRYCEVNECLQGSPCGSSQCIKYNGSYSCFDPCNNYTLLDDPWRSTSNVHNYNDYLYSYDWVHCDSALSGWYRLKIGSSQQMPEYCVPKYSCGSHAPMWLKGSHPTIGDGIVNRTACANWYEDCCFWSNTVSVKKCPGGYYVYKIQGTPTCYLSYCIESNYSCSNLSCASDEECRFVNGVEGCHCKNSSYISSWIQPENLADYVTPKVLCGLDTIEVTFSKCLLENLGYNTSSFHLISDFCRGVYSKQDKAYITLSTKPINGFCGGYTTSTQNVITYENTVYLTPKAEEGNKRKEYAINFKCSYPANMDINLITPINSLTASVTINVTGTSNFTITMGLFQDSGYTTPYTGSEVWLDSSSILYVGVLVTGSSGSSPFVLLMKNCYATSTANETYGMRYDIIKDRCPNKNNPTISVPENGISLKGRFSFQVFKYLGGFDQVYLHCQVGLCDTSSYDCSAGCPLVRAADSVETLKTFTLGPIKYKASSSSNGGSQSSDGGAAVPTTKLFISAIVFLLILY